MKIGLIDVDGSRSFPNLALMKISAWHKAQGDAVEWWWGWSRYDRVYMSKVFSTAYSPDVPEPANAAEVVKGGTGYAITTESGKEVYHPELDRPLPPEVEHMCPDYTLYPQFANTAYGFLTRGCGRKCPSCLVSAKEGCVSRKVAELSQWWWGQRDIKLLDPNLLACREHMALLGQLADSGARVDFTQGLDARLLNEENIALLNRVRLKNIHFAWDFMKDEAAVLRGLELYRGMAARRPHGCFGVVYCLTNYDTTHEEDLHRVYTLRDLGYDPFVMVYDKPGAPQATQDLQRWCNNRKVFRTVPRFGDYDRRKEHQRKRSGQLL